MRALRLMLCAFLLVTLGLAGCASSTPAPSILPAAIWWPVANAPAKKADTGKAKRATVKRIACPELAKSDVDQLTGTVPRPADWAEKGATAGGLQTHVDALELDKQATVGAAKRVIGEHEKCRGGPPPATKKSKAKAT